MRGTQKDEQFVVLSTPAMRRAKSRLGIARKAEKRATDLAAAEPTESNVVAAAEATKHSRAARTNFEVERAHEALLAISGPTTGEQRNRLGRAVRVTQDEQS